MFCVSCGRELDASARFCSYCGAKQVPDSPGPQAGAPANPSAPAEPPAPARPATPGLREAPLQAAVAVAPPPAPEAAPAAPPPRKGEKKRRPLVGKLLLLLLLLGAAFLGLKALAGYLNGPDRTISRFLEAVRAQDADALGAVATLTGGDLELNGDTLAPFFAAYSQDAGRLDALQASLENDLASLEQGRRSMGGAGIRLVKDGNPLFSSYKVELTACSVALSSEFDGAALLLDGTEYQVGREPRYITLLPGVYSASASYVDPATGIALDCEASLRCIGPSSSAVHCSFDHCGAWLQTNVPELQLTAIAVDGRPYAGDLSGLNPQAGFSLTPVGADSEITVAFTAAGLAFERTFRTAEGTYCLLEAGLRTVSLGSRQPGVKVEAVYVDGTPYAADLSGLDPFGGFDLGPVPADSQLLVRFSLAGTPFQQSFPASAGRCVLDPGLPEDVLAAGETLAADLALLIVELEGSYDTELLLQLERIYGGSSPAFVSQWTERVRSAAAELDRTVAAYNDNTYASYVRFDGLQAVSVASGEPAFQAGRTTLTCTVELTSAGVTEYWWGTDEAFNSYPEAVIPPIAVELAYANGQWQALGVSW